MDICDHARAWHKVLLRILRVDPALNGMAGDLNVLLAHGERFPRRDLDLLFDEVHVRDSLRHRMLHLDPRIHFHKIEIFIFI